MHGRTMRVGAAQRAMGEPDALPTNRLDVEMLITT
jgi:hypothetical protein